MKIPFEAECYAYLDAQGVDISLFLHSHQNDPFEFEFSYKDMLEAIVESHRYPHSGKLDKEGLQALREVQAGLKKLNSRINQILKENSDETE